MAIAVAAISASRARAAGFRPERRKDAATRPKARALVVALGPRLVPLRLRAVVEERGERVPPVAGDQPSQETRHGRQVRDIALGHLKQAALNVEGDGWARQKFFASI